MTGETGISLVVLLGPTASGKTEISLRWATRLGFEIVSADSVQVYRYMDIGTAKPPLEIRSQIPHHLIDVADPDELYNAARFQEEADRAIRQIHERGRPILVVAGTGLYLRALTRGLFPDGGSDPALRESLQKRARREGVGALYQMLRQVDPEASRRIHPNDLFRIVRALEVFLLSGTPISRHHMGHAMGRERYRTMYLGLEREREELGRRIETRVDQMMAQGLLGEVRALMEKGYGPGLPSMAALGYRHMAAHLRGEMPLDEAIRMMKRDTKRFARRQMTWFRAMSEVAWFRPEQEEEVLEAVGRFLKQGEACTNPPGAW